jgi:hypothetical protein
VYFEREAPRGFSGSDLYSVNKVNSGKGVFDEELIGTGRRDRGGGVGLEDRGIPFFSELKGGLFFWNCRHR